MKERACKRPGNEYRAKDFSLTKEGSQRTKDLNKNSGEISSNNPQFPFSSPRQHQFLSSVIVKGLRPTCAVAERECCGVVAQLLSE
ncbi:hypothetical protein RRG08_030663 [Elysia crispata]|uniref:Uncharacterized protein n=1 Tax=Elysia crispata TaxID=231223 RepID=A0AAE1CZD0_9GAST|nr:hypothetical protein RRG08_030663 [Elysia crispata]